MKKGGLLSLFEDVWFYHQILSPPKLIRPSHSNPRPKAKRPSCSTAISNSTRSPSSKEPSSKTDEDNNPAVLVSPNSVLPTPRLYSTLPKKAKPGDPMQQTKRGGRKRSKKPVLHGKSLQELEMEELQGFLDLGFTFDEREIDSRLVSIVPGLQRLIGKNNDYNAADAGEEDDEAGGIIRRTHVSRPYLSEAWEVVQWKSREKNQLLINWRISATGDGIHVKEQLRWWAHAVASTVR